MVIRLPHFTARRDGAMMFELLVAVGLLAGTLLPLAFSVAAERKLALAYYQRGVAMEIVDGEMEALAAGGWRAFPAGTQEYRVHANAATNLPPGQFLLTIDPAQVRLEWRPAIRQHGGSVVREVKFK